MLKRNIISLLLLIWTVFILDIFDIRICPFFNIFNLPCPGCGMTRAFKLILKGDIVGSFKYNMLTFPLFLLCLIYLTLFICKKEYLIENVFKKHKTLIIIVTFIVTLIEWIININNPLLY